MIQLLTALLFAAMGLAALLRPALVADLFSLGSLRSDMRSEIRAVYGGYGLVIAGLLYAASQSATLEVGIVITVACSLLAMAAGRLISLMIDGQLDRFPAIFLAIEVVFGALLIVSIM